MSKRDTRYEPRDTNGTYAVILVGGKGKRLQPLSTERRPKAFISVTKDRKTMFARTVERMLKIAPASRVIVVANRMHAALVKRDFPRIRPSNIILEPLSKNTAPALALAGRAILERDEDAVMAVVPTDQYITDEKRYLGSIKEAIDFVKNSGDVLVVLGVRPKGSSPEFGYIKISSAHLAGRKNIYKVDSFVEKPDKKTAARYLADGKHLWHIGAFVFKASSLLAAFRRHAPAIYYGSWRKMPEISLDYAVMEKADNVYCAAGSYGWRDMGTFDSLKEILDREGRCYLLKGRKIMKIL